MAVINNDGKLKERVKEAKKNEKKKQKTSDNKETSKKETNEKNETEKKPVKKDDGTYKYRPFEMFFKKKLEKEENK